MKFTKATAIIFLSDPFEYDNNHMLEITQANLATIKKQYNEDPRYFSSSEGKKTLKEKGGLVHLSKAKLEQVIWEIKTTNSIQYVKRGDAETLASFIYDKKGLSTLSNLLRQGDESLVDEMVNHLQQGKPNGSRQLSWCSKICKYIDYWENEESHPSNENRYAIYDGVLRAVLPYYLNKYGIRKKNGRKWTPAGMGRQNILEYGEYNQTIGELLKKIGGNMTKHEFDLLLWYYYKRYKKDDLASAVSALIA